MVEKGKSKYESKEKKLPLTLNGDEDGEEEQRGKDIGGEVVVRQCHFVNNTFQKINEERQGINTFDFFGD